MRTSYQRIGLFKDEKVLLGMLFFSFALAIMGLIIVWQNYSGLTALAVLACLLIYFLKMQHSLSYKAKAEKLVIIYIKIKDRLKRKLDPIHNFEEFQQFWKEVSSEYWRSIHLQESYENAMSHSIVDSRDKLLLTGSGQGELTDKYLLNLVMQMELFGAGLGGSEEQFKLMQLMTTELDSTFYKYANKND